MNLSQFKSWFEGFTENMSGPPNKKQWARIQERVEEISPDPMPATVFIDRYIRPYPRWWEPMWTAQNQQATNTAIKQLSGTNEHASFYNAGALEAKQVASNAG